MRIGTGLLLNVFIAALCALFLLAADQPSAVEPPHQFVAPPKLLKHFTFGYNENLSDTLWMRVIQDFGYCEDRINPLDDTSGFKDGKKCNQGWVYQMLDAISQITPKFRIIYTVGATTLSVLVDDKIGAAKIFERGVENYPNDWVVLYRAAYHNLIELNKPEYAAELLVRAGKNGAPVWVYSLAGKLYTEQGKALVAKTILEDAIKTHEGSKYVARLKERLDAVNRAVDNNSSELPKMRTALPLGP